MLRMFNLRKWTELSDGGALSFHSTRARLVKLELNSPGPVKLHIRYPDGVYARDEVANDGSVVEVIAPGTDYFLGKIDGRETLETWVDGQFDLFVEGGTCFVFTADGDDVHAVVLDPVIFTRIAERRARNPELEAIERRMYLNQERRLAAQMEDMERRYGAALSDLEERAVHAERRAIARERAAAASVEAAASGSEQAVDEQALDKDAGPGSDDKATGRKAAADPDAKKGSGKG